MGTIPTLLVSMLGMFSYSIIYQASLLMTDYSLIVRGDEENKNTALSFGLNSLTIVFMYVLSILVFIYCVIIIISFVSKTRAMTLLGCICSLFTFCVTCILVIMMIMVLTTSDTELKHLFDSKNLTIEEDTFKGELERAYACCGYDYNTEISFSCNSDTTATIYCGEQIHDSFAQIMYDLFVPVLLIGCCCVFMGIVSGFMFFQQKKEETMNEWGNEFYA